MNINYRLVSILLLVLFQNISLASIWSDYIWINDDKTIISDTYADYDIYLGYVSNYDIDRLVIPLENIGEDATISSIESSQYSSMLHIYSGSMPKRGEHFQLTAPSAELYVLYDSEFQIIGTYSSMLDASVIAYAGETYEIGPGQEVELIGYQFNNPGYTHWVSGADYSRKCDSGWNINGKPVPQNVTYEYLTDTLGLTNGTYELELYVEWYYGGEDQLVFWDTDTTTITIVPEPVSIISLGLGGVILIRKK